MVLINLHIFFSNLIFIYFKNVKNIIWLWNGLVGTIATVINLKKNLFGTLINNVYTKLKNKNITKKCIKLIFVRMC